MTYSTRLGLLYPLGHPIDLDQSWDPWQTPTWFNDGNEGRWYVAGWSGRDGLDLHRDREMALVGEWTYAVTLGRVIGSEQWVVEWERDRDKGKGGERRGMVELVVVKAGEGWTAGTRAKLSPEDVRVVTVDTPPCGSLLLCYTEKESHGVTEHDQDRRFSGGWWNPHTPPWNMLRQEWALGCRSDEDDPHPLIYSLPYSRLTQGDWFLFHRYIRRGVMERWHVVDVCATEDKAVRGIGTRPLPIPVDPRYAAYVEVELALVREVADFEAVAALERTNREREVAEWRQHRRASDLAFGKLLGSKDEESRRLALQYNATLTHLMQTRSELVKELEGDEEFRGLYQAVMDAERVPAKRKAVKEVLGWLWTRKRVKVKVGPNEEPTTT